MVAIDNRLRLVQAESERLRQYLSALPGDAWTRPSACGHWQVGDVVAHLIIGAEFYTATVSHGLQGDLSPPEGYPDAGAVNGSSASELIDQGTYARRQSLGDQLLSTFNATTGQLNQLLCGLVASHGDIPCYHLGGIFPARTFIDLRIFELAVHGWDIRSRLEPSANLSCESLPVLMDMFPTFIGWLFRPGPKLPAPVRYRFELTGTMPTGHDIVVEGDKASMESAVATGADVTLRSDTDTFLLVMLGRLSINAAIADARLAMEGDGRLATEFNRWFQGA